MKEGKLIINSGFNITKEALEKIVSSKISKLKLANVDSILKGPYIFETIKVDKNFDKQSALNDIAQKQIVRVRNYVAKTESTLAIPVIVTLHQEKIDFVKQVPVVPILQLSSFLDEFYGNLDKMKTIEK